MIKKEAEKPKDNSNHEEQENTENIPQTNTKDQQIEELTNTLQRLQADFQNYKKRIDKEHISTIKNANASLIKELLAVLDSFELAIKNNHENNPEIAKFKRGLEMIYAQLYSVLESEGLRMIETKNKKFDPFKHEVLMIKESDEPEDTILQEFQKGYILNDNVLRHSKVMIAKKKTNDKQGDTHE